MKEMSSSGSNNAHAELNLRVAELENNFVELKQGTPASWQRWIEVLSKLLLPLLLFWLVFTFKDSVQHALEYQRLEVESAEAIEKLLQTLHKEEVEIAKSMAAALTMAAYGEAAIVPLVGALEHGSANTETAVKQGLFILGLSHPVPVSRTLGMVLSKRKRQFRWQTHQAAIEIIGKVEHPKARDILMSYRVLLEKPAAEGLTGWQQTVKGAKQENYEITQKTLITALAAFGFEWNPSNTGGKK